MRGKQSLENFQDNNRVGQATGDSFATKQRDVQSSIVEYNGVELDHLAWMVLFG